MWHCQSFANYLKGIFDYSATNGIYLFIFVRFIYYFVLLSFNCYLYERTVKPVLSEHPLLSGQLRSQNSLHTFTPCKTEFLYQSGCLYKAGADKHLFQTDTVYENVVTGSEIQILSGP